MDQQTVDLCALDDVLATLTRLKTNGGHLNEDFFRPKDIMDVDLRYHDRVAAKLQQKAFFSVLASMKSIRDVLQNTLTAVEHAIYDVQEHCTPLTDHIGMHSLPNELLSQIFEAGYWPELPDARNNDFSIAVSQVCRQFRDVAFQTPTIWSVLSQKFPPDQLKAFIQRSKTSELLINLTKRPTDNDITDFLTATLPHADRWKEFRYTYLKDQGETEAFQAGIAFSSLTSISMFSPDTWECNCLPVSPPYFMDHMGSPQASLLHFSSINVIPVEGDNQDEHSSSWAETLITCDLCFIGYSDECQLYMGDLFQFLHITSQLEVLKLRFDGNLNNAIADSRRDYDTATLPKLRRLDITLVDAEYPECLHFLFDFLRAPNLSVLTMDIRMSGLLNHANWDPSGDLQDVAHRYHLSPRTLEIRFNSVRPQHADAVFLYLSTMLPIHNLTHLSVEAQAMALEDTGLRRFIRHLLLQLQTLRFLQCDLLTAEALLDVVREYIVCGSDLQVLEIRNCTTISKDLGAIERLQTILGDKFLFTK